VVPGCSTRGTRRPDESPGQVGRRRQQRCRCDGLVLVPGAKRLGANLRDLDDDIDGMVAGQPWIEIRKHGGSPPKAIAATILRNVERGIQAEHGVGDYGARTDKTRPGR